MRGAYVAQVVEADCRHAGTLRRGFQGAVAEVRRVDDATDLDGERETAGAIQRAHPLHIFKLPRQMPSEGLDGAVRKSHGPPAVPRFGRPHEDLTTVPR